MRKLKRKPTTVYLDPQVARAARMKSALTDMSVSDQVNEALRRSLREDESDLKAIDETRREPERPFEDLLKDMRRDGLL